MDCGRGNMAEKDLRMAPTEGMKQAQEYKTISKVKSIHRFILGSY